MDRKGRVLFKNRSSGIIEETETGYRFTYDREYLSGDDARPISVTLPLRTEPFAARVLFPFFDGLIPEGWLLKIAAKNWKLDERDRMGLLLTVCRDCIGAVSVERIDG